MLGEVAAGRVVGAAGTWLVVTERAGVGEPAEDECTTMTASAMSTTQTSAATACFVLCPSVGRSVPRSLPHHFLIADSQPLAAWSPHRMHSPAIRPDQGHRRRTGPCPTTPMATIEHIERPALDVVSRAGWTSDDPTSDDRVSADSRNVSPAPARYQAEAPDPVVGGFHHLVVRGRMRRTVVASATFQRTVMADGDRVRLSRAARACGCHLDSFADRNCSGPSRQSGLTLEPLA